MKNQKIILLLLFFQFITGQNKEITHQSLYWIRYSNQITLSEKWSWQNEIENRRFFQNNTQHHFITHTRIHYKFAPKTDFALGFSYGLQSPQDPNATIRLAVPEIRPYQEINHSQPLTEKWSLKHRFRLDERFFRDNNGKELFNSYNFNFRFRYQIQAQYIISKPKSNSPTTLKIADELMINTGKNIVNNTFDQNRIYIGIEQKLNDSFSAEIGYFNWFQQRTSGYQFFDRDILRFTLIHKFKL